MQTISNIGNSMFTTMTKKVIKPGCLTLPQLDTLRSMNEPPIILSGIPKKNEIKSQKLYPPHLLSHDGVLL